MFEKKQYNQSVWVGGKPYLCQTWRPGMPVLTGRVGLDTETYKIENGYTTPDVVIMQVCDGKKAYMIYWDDISEYLRLTREKEEEIELFYLCNAAFDLRVLYQHDRPLGRWLYELCANNKVVDLLVRFDLWTISTKGITMHPSLDRACQYRMGLALDKKGKKINRSKASVSDDEDAPVEEEEEEDIRTGYNREETIEQESFVYGITDPIATWLLGEDLEPQATECAQTRAAIALDNISQNGMLVDREMFDAKRASMVRALRKELAAIELLGYNPLTRKSSKEIIQHVADLLRIQCVDGMPERIGFEHVQKLCVFALANLHEPLPAFQQAMAHAFGGLAFQEKDVTPKTEDTPIQQACKALGLGAVASTRKPKPYAHLLASAVKAALNGGQKEGKPLEMLRMQHDKNNGWLNIEDADSPTQFIQKYLENFEKIHKFTFARTAGGKDGLGKKKIKLSKNDVWMLEDAKLSDPFIKGWMTFKHTEKLISTYFNPVHIQGDNRIHPRFTTLVRTGRTSARRPNSQNPPQKGGYRECFIPAFGKVFCSVDYSQLELGTLAEFQYIAFGKSKLGDLINNGIDCHAWFAGRKAGIITEENDFDGTPERLAQLKPIIKELKEHPGRKGAKSANFGLPGGMGVKTFYANCRAQGMKITMQECKELRDSWLKNFPEMTAYFDTIEEVEAVNPEKPGMRYKSWSFTGRTRSYCSRCSACNFRFQAPAADGAKAALWYVFYWNLDNDNRLKMVNFIHTSYINRTAA